MPSAASDEDREETKRAFNAHPDQSPLRILIATDAAREGINLQNHCADLFHFDVPWNPSRMEQRNGRIARVLQRAPEVRCHYFVFRQRPEDRVLETLVKKTDRIRRELAERHPYGVVFYEKRTDYVFIEKFEKLIGNAPIERIEVGPGVKLSQEEATLLSQTFPEARFGVW